MEEKRKAKRMPVTLSLEISNLFKQDNVQVSDIHAPIDVINISKTGIAFRTKSLLPIGYYFTANINLGTEDTLRCVVEIVRSHLDEDATIYGCEFVGMAEVLTYIFDDYDQKITDDKE